jgi:aryl-alcohol dehydrogenase-like predicted oxidoreductase
MEYRLLGSSGCAVSALALGTLTFGNETDEAASFSQLDRFTEAGGNLVDSADVYADGRAEEIIGRWLAARPGRRELVVLATKGRFPTDESPKRARPVPPASVAGSGRVAAPAERGDHRPVPRCTPGIR